MTAGQVIERTRAYIMENFLYTRRDFVVGEDDSLLERGIIDSIGVMELVQFIEGDFGVKIDDQDITEQNMGSLRAIGAFVSTRAKPGAMVA